MLLKRLGKFLSKSRSLALIYSLWHHINSMDQKALEHSLFAVESFWRDSSKVLDRNLACELGLRTFYSFAHPFSLVFPS